MIKIGIIGVGEIANHVHIPDLLRCSGASITAICDINDKALTEAGDRLGIDKKYRFTDYRDLINCSEVDAVEICTPNHLHIEMAVFAVKAGKAVEVEKPLALRHEDTVPLLRALCENPVPNMVCMSYRFKPAVRFAKWIMEHNLIGDIISIDVQYLKSSAFMEGRRLEWRFVKKYAGSGVLGDLGVHLIDLATFLAGDIKKVSAQTKIVVRERKKLDSEEYAPVETDDYCAFIAEMQNDVTANFVISRCAIGNSNTIKFDVFATNGVLSFNLNNPKELDVCIGEVDIKGNGLHTVQVPKEFYVEQEQSFVNLINGEQCDYIPHVSEGVRLQKILDSILRSANDHKWVAIEY